MQGVRRAEPQLGEVSLVIGLGLIGQLVVRLLAAAGIRVLGLDVIEDRCRLAEQAGAVLCAAPDAEGLDAITASLDELTSAHGADHVFLAAGGSYNARLDRGQAVQVPGQGGGHRQDQAGPALDRLLRQGARRPVLPVLRPGPVGRPVRAGGDRLPGGYVREPSAATWSVPGPAGAQGPRGRDADLRHIPDADASRSTPTCPPARSRRSGPSPNTRHRTPGALARCQPGPFRRPVRPGKGLEGAERTGRQAPGHRLHRRGQLRLVDAAAAPGAAAGRAAGARGDYPVAVGGERPAAVRLHHRLDQRPGRAGRRVAGRDLRRDPPRHPRGPGCGPWRRARRCSWRSPSR